MSRIHTATVYKFEELSAAAKEKAREWYRQGMMSDDQWHEYTLEDATKILELLGYFEPKIQYSGFWSQGDGACFTGTWYARDCDADALKRHASEDTELHRIADELAALKALHPDMRATLTHRGHYSHEYMIRFEPEFDEVYADDAILAADTAITELSLSLMRWIYRTLKTEWEYQNADAQVDEAIIANEYEFTAEGNRCVVI